MSYKKVNWSKENVENACKNCCTYYDAVFLCGGNVHGGNVETLKKFIAKYGIDVSYFYINKGIAFRRGPRTNKFTVEFDNLKNNKNRLIRITREIGWLCETCGLQEWQGQKIPLEIHHIDGNGKNNKRTNIQALCPNCHTLTDNWRGRKKKK